MRKRFTFFIVLFIIAILVPIIFLLIVSFRNYSIETATQKAKIIAKIVRDGLTTHMEHGIMDKRDYFLAKIKNIEGVENIKILRGPSVDKQFGKSFESGYSLDPLEKEVLQKGVEKEEIIETPKKVELKVVIPYIASAYNHPNCLKCHQAKEGEVLGAISMQFDITQVRSYSLILVGKILLIVLILGALATYMLNRQLLPYAQFFESLKNVLKAAFEGDYTKRLGEFRDRELSEAAYWLNSLLEKIETALKKISKNVNYFIDYTSKSSDPLESMRELVEELASIYKFKDIIDKDSDVLQIYQRLGELFQTKFGLDRFALYEYDAKEGKRYLRFTSNYTPICSAADEEIEVCRAYNTRSAVNSDRYLGICRAVKEKGAFYICLPVTIIKERSVVLTIVPKDEEEYRQVRKSVKHFLNYLNISKTTLETKSLMEELKIQSLVDRMTGAFNRRYLDIFVKKSVPQALRTDTPYSLLMVDIDHFKMVNDTYGHDAGDRVIETLVDSIKKNIRESDVVVRFGGEEFLVLLHNCKKDDAVRIANKIRDHFKKRRIDVGEEKISKTVSIGVSEFPADTSRFWQAIKYADMALYRAKEQGRDRVVVYAADQFEQKEEY